MFVRLVSTLVRRELLEAAGVYINRSFDSKSVDFPPALACSQPDISVWTAVHPAGATVFIPPAVFHCGINLSPNMAKVVNCAGIRCIVEGVKLLQCSRKRHVFVEFAIDKVFLLKAVLYAEGSKSQGSLEEQKTAAPKPINKAMNVVLSFIEDIIWDVSGAVTLDGTLSVLVGWG